MNTGDIIVFSIWINVRGYFELSAARRVEVVSDWSSLVLNEIAVPTYRPMPLRSSLYAFTSDTGENKPRGFTLLSSDEEATDEEPILQESPLNAR